MTDRVTMEEKFFSTPFFFSYSGLNKLLFSPRLWYKHYVLQDREERTDAHLVEGKVIHALLLDEDNFAKNFTVLPGKLPTASTRSVIDTVFRKRSEAEGRQSTKLADYTKNILETLEEINLHQSLKTDEQRIKKILAPDIDEYWEFLLEKDGKDVIDIEMLERCKEASERLRENAKIADLLKLGNTNKKITVHNEIKAKRVAEDNVPFGLKGILDNVVIDDENKKATINDVKTTGKTIEDFEETVEYYNYWLQAAIYRRLAADLIPADYEFQFNFIVIDKYQQVYAFEVSKKTMETWNTKLDEVLKKAKWHYKNRKFELPYKFEVETVIL